jgi:hypothetical protein
MTPNKVASQLADSIPKEFQEAFARVVQAGMKVMFSEQTHSLMVEQLQAEGDIAQNIGKGVASLMGLLFEKSNGTMPQEVMIPAGIYLIAKGSEFIEQIAGQEVTPDVIAEATDVFVETLLGSAGVDPQKFRKSFEEGAAEAEGGQPKGMLASAEREPGQPEEPDEATEGETPEEEAQEEEME